MSNLRKFKRAKKRNPSEQKTIMTSKGQIIHDNVVMQYIELLTEGKTLEAEMFVDSLVQEKDIVGFMAIEWVHSTAASLLGIDYKSLPREQQKRFLFDNPGYVRGLVRGAEKEAEDKNCREHWLKMADEKLDIIHSDAGQKVLNQYYDEMIPKWKKD